MGITRSTILAKELDSLFGRYYFSRQNPNYFDDEGKGRFWLFCEEKGWFDILEEEIYVDDVHTNRLLEFIEKHDDFPSFESLRESDGLTHKKEQFLYLLRHFYEHRVILYKLSWSNIAESLKHEMFPEIGIKLHEVIMSQDDQTESQLSADIMFNEQKEKVIDLLQEKVKLSNKEVIFIRKALERARNTKSEIFEPSTKDPYFAPIYDLSDDDAQTEKIDFSPRWKGLNAQMLFDVYAVHKCHRYTFRQMEDYPLNEFIRNAMNADANIFENIGISEFVCSQDFRKRAERLSLFPQWLINDDVFSIITLIYGITDFARCLQAQQFNPSATTIRTYVIPQSVVSVYDQSCSASLDSPIDIPQINLYLKQKGVHQFAAQRVLASVDSPAAIESVISELYEELQNDHHSNIVILCDRRKIQETGNQEITIFKSTNWHSFDEVTRNGLIGFDLELGGADENDSDVPRAYLNYGIRQKFRFYPEFMVSVVPKLFVTPTMMTEYEFIAKLYSAEYKKGWNLNLDDETFNAIYKAITGTTHETNNYYRPKGFSDDKEQKFGFFRFVQRRFVPKHGDAALRELNLYFETNHYDSDTVIYDILDRNTKNEEESNITLFMKTIGQSELMTLKQSAFDWKQMECGAHNVFNITDCAHIQRLIENLRRFQESNFMIHSINHKHFSLKQIIGDFDHLVSVHNMFSGDDTARIQRYIANLIDCKRGNDCLMMGQFRNRRNENQKKSKVNSNDENTSQSAVLNDVLCEIHCYLLHRNNELYRLSSQNEQAHSKFTSLVKEEESTNDQEDQQKKEEPLSIDFGVPVTRWLPFGDEPLFESMRDEMVYNKDSTVSEQGYIRMETECAAKIKTEQFDDYSLDEMTGFKFYSDYTTDCANLRKAHWKSMPLSMKKRYYHWARTIYRGSLRHATPIPLQNKKKKGSLWLYHGLSRLFRMDKESPTYFGPFSSTLSMSIADEFSNGKGIRLDVKSQYADAMRRCLGLDMRSISCFKREQEILLVDQPIPVQSAQPAEAFSLDYTTMSNHFLYSLKSRRNEIRDPNEFYRKLGVKFKPKFKKDWISTFLNHKLLFSATQYGGKSIYSRLVVEFGIYDIFYESTYFSAEFVDAIHLDETGCITVDIDSRSPKQFTVWNPIQSEEQDLFQIYEFVVQSVSNSGSDTATLSKYRFSDVTDFKIFIANHITLTQRINAVDIVSAVELYQVKIAVQIRNLFDVPVPIKILEVPLISTDEIFCGSLDPFRIDRCVNLLYFDEVRHRGGKLCVASASSIIIGKQGGINALNCGIRRASSFGNGCHLKYGQYIGETQEVQNMVNTLSKLIRLDDVHDVVLVPSSVILGPAFFKENRFVIAPMIEALEVNQVGLMYKGIFYVRKKKPSGLVINTDNSKSPQKAVTAVAPRDVVILVTEALDELISNTEPKLMQIRDTIIDYFSSHWPHHQELDASVILDKNKARFTTALLVHCKAKPKQLEASIGALHDLLMEKIDYHPKHNEKEMETTEELMAFLRQNVVENTEDWMDPMGSKRTDDLRIYNERNNKDITLRWIKIGCGSCFIQDRGDGQSEIGPPLDRDNKNGFPKLLRESLLRDALLSFCIDYSIPYRSDSKNGAGGGIIAFVTAGPVVNNGELFCKSSSDGVFSGGTISIVTDREFLNNGRISCGRDGFIHIHCRKIVNEGVIEPAATIQITNEQTAGHCIETLAKTEREKRIRMRVVHHDGHIVNHMGDHHPQNLLEPGHHSCYQGIGCITFQIDTKEQVFITNIGIRKRKENSESPSVVKRISIEGSADNQSYQQWIEIGGIQNGFGAKPFEIYPVDISASHHARIHGWRFYRLRILENHGWKYNCLFEFVLFGIEE